MPRGASSQAMGGDRGGLAPKPATKLVMALMAYVFHAVISTVRASPAMMWAISPQHDLSTPGFASSGKHSELPIERVDPLTRTFDIIMIAGLVLLGGVFAGLTLGLMGLDMVNLQVLMTSGTEQEQRDATKVMRLLERGRHWVLVVLLLGNVIVNETLPIFLSEFGSGLTAVIISTILIVIFGEIVPQSICARYGLTIGAVCAPLVHFAMIVLAPVAWPTAKLLDYCSVSYTHLRAHET